MTRAPHIPGQNVRPPEGSIPAGEAEGRALYEAGYFWEAHEAWEPVWMAAAPNSAERAGLQAMIQLANARLKLVMGQEGAVARILPRLDEHLSRAGQGTRADWVRQERESLRQTGAENVQNSAQTAGVARADPVSN